MAWWKKSRTETEAKYKELKSEYRMLKRKYDNRVEEYHKLLRENKELKSAASLTKPAKLNSEMVEEIDPEKFLSDEKKIDIERAACTGAILDLLVDKDIITYEEFFESKLNNIAYYDQLWTEGIKIQEDKEQEL